MDLNIVDNGKFATLVFGYYIKVC